MNLDPVLGHEAVDGDDVLELVEEGDAGGIAVVADRTEIVEVPVLLCSPPIPPVPRRQLHFEHVRLVTGETPHRQSPLRRGDPQAERRPRLIDDAYPPLRLGDEARADDIHRVGGAPVLVIDRIVVTRGCEIVGLVERELADTVVAATPDADADCDRLKQPQLRGEQAQLIEKHGVRHRSRRW